MKSEGNIYSVSIAEGSLTLNLITKMKIEEERKR